MQHMTSLILIFYIIYFFLVMKDSYTSTKMDVDDMGHSTEWMLISLEVLEPAGEVQDNGMVFKTFLPSYPMKME